LALATPLQVVEVTRREVDRKKKLGRLNVYCHDFAHKNLFGREVNEELARVAKRETIPPAKPPCASG